MFDRLFRHKPKPADPKEVAEKERQRREALKERHRAEGEMAKQRGWIEGGSSW